MSASPEFFQPSAAPAYTPRILLATAADHGDDFYTCRTPTGAGISYLGAPATCPPAPMKPRPPPATACKKRLFAAAAGDIIALNFDDLEAIFRPASVSVSDGKPPRRASSRNNTTKPTGRSNSARRSVVGAFR